MQNNWSMIKVYTSGQSAAEMKEDKDYLRKVVEEHDKSRNQMVRFQKLHR